MLAGTERFELSPTVLETVMLPLTPSSYITYEYIKLYLLNIFIFRLQVVGFEPIQSHATFHPQLEAALPLSYTCISEKVRRAGFEPASLHTLVEVFSYQLPPDIISVFCRPNQLHFYIYVILCSYKTSRYTVCSFLQGL